MRIEDLKQHLPTQQAPALRPDLPAVESQHPDVQELITRFNANQELDCPALDRGELAFIGAIYIEVVHDPSFHPTPEILALIRTMNAQMRLSSGEAEG